MKKIKLACVFVIAILTNGYSQTPGAGNNSVQSSLEMDTILHQGPEYNFITPLAGKWKAVQTIYAIDGQKILSRDTFKVDRKMVGNFLQEIMQPIVESKSNTFTRTSYLNYNRTNVRWEYIVLDTRYPVMMFETSADHQVKNNSIDLYLDAFTIPPFVGKEFGGMLGKEHRVVIFESNNVNIHRQYWTLPGGKKFLAIEYVFKRL